MSLMKSRCFAVGAVGHVALLLLAISCAPHSAQTPMNPDPFIGFYANPDLGMLELTGKSPDGIYHGSIWIDFGPFAVALQRDGNFARGNVTYGGSDHTLEIEHTAEGMMIVEKGKRVFKPMKRYKNRSEYERLGKAK